MTERRTIIPGDERWAEAQKALAPIYGRRVALSGWKQAAVSSVGCYTRDGKVLMLLRSGGTDAQAKWGLVGGLIAFVYKFEHPDKEDEGIFDTLVRETREETGIQLTPEWAQQNAVMLTPGQRKNAEPGYQGDFSSLAFHFQLPLPDEVVVEKLEPTREAAAFKLVSPEDAMTLLKKGQIAFPMEVRAIAEAVYYAPCAAQMRQARKEVDLLLAS